MIDVKDLWDKLGRPAQLVLSFLADQPGGRAPIAALSAVIAAATIPQAVHDLTTRGLGRTTGGVLVIDKPRVQSLRQRGII